MKEKKKSRVQDDIKERKKNTKPNPHKLNGFLLLSFVLFDTYQEKKSCEEHLIQLLL